MYKRQDKYILPWTEAFPDAMILMRRPFASAEKYGFGLYNDMTGQPEATQSWLGWINNGGEYDQTGEKNVIVPMNDFWKTAPSGGELTSSLSMEEMLDTNLSGTCLLYTSFLFLHLHLSDSLFHLPDFRCFFLCP